MIDKTASSTTNAISLHRVLFQEQDTYAVLISDSNNIIVDWNAAAERMYGYSREEAIGNPTAMLHRSLSAAEQRFHITESIARNGCWADKIAFKRKDGSTGVSDTIVFGYHNEDGEQCYVGLNRDFTERWRARNALRETDERLHKITEHIPAAVVCLDRDQRYLFVNKGAEDMFGYCHEKIVGKSAAEVMSEDVYKIKAPYIEAALSGEEVTFEWDTAASEGRQNFYQTHYFPHFDEHEQVIGYYAVSLDITDRKRAEKKLLQTTEAAELIRKITVAANHAENLEGAIQACLDRVCRYSGFPVGHAYLFNPDDSEELISANLWHLEDSARFSEFRIATEKTRVSPGIGLAGHVVTTGAPRWMEADSPYLSHPRAKARIACGLETGFAVPIMVGQQVAAVLEFFTDRELDQDPHLLDIASQVGVLIGRVMERQRIKDIREAYEKRLGGMVDISSEAIISIDAGGLIRLFNKGAETIFGYEGPEIVGEPFETLLPERLRSDQAMHIAEFSQSADVSRLINPRGTLYGRRRDGSEFPAEASISKLDLPTETVLIVTLRDITERMEAEQTLLAAKESAEQTSRAKSEFLANMSHELRTPLNAIIGFSDLLIDQPLDASGDTTALDYAVQIHDSGQHLLALIDDILDIAKIEAGTAVYNEEDIDIPTLIRACITMVDERAKVGNVNIKFDVDEEFLPRLRAEAARVKQVMLNLLSNAIKFTEPGGTVTIKAWHNVTSGFVLQVIDTGIGIASKDIPKALARFQQVDGALNRRHAGTGLGLPMAKSLVEQHGGTLDMQSEVGAGTTVTVRLPAQRIVDPADIEAA